MRSVLHQFGVLLLLLFAAAGAVAGYYVRRIFGEKKIENAEKISRRMIDEARREAENRKKEANLTVKEEMHKARSEFEVETKERRHELLALEKRVIQKEENLERKVGLIERKERGIEEGEKRLSDRERGLAQKKKELERLQDEGRRRLHRISGLSREEARRTLLDQMREEVGREATAMAKRIESEAREQAEKKARQIITLAIERCAADHVSETTVSTISLPSDDMKGRIIGREGRNIRVIEASTGVDVIIDDTPEAVIISGFDPIRKEVAKISLQRLVADGRINPARIEEVVGKVKKEVDELVRETGEAAAFDVGLHGLHPELITVLGRLKFRTSYGQNVLQHSVELARLMGVMAGELGLDIPLAKRIGMLHDIGKAVDHEVEGPHAVIGAELAKKYGESPEVIHGILAHHGDVEPRSIYAVLASAADALSAARPGARSETLEGYIKRLEKLEGIAASFNGVENAYAIQAGREVRVMVEADKVDDIESSQICRNIARKIQAELEYPGQIKVMVIRETRAIDYAK